MKTVFRVYILPVVVAATLLLLVRSFVLTQYASDGALVEWGILPEDRILVNKLAYSSNRPPQRGNKIVFEHPLMPDRPICFATCTALPGDTLWYDPTSEKIIATKSTLKAHPIVVPAKGIDIDITPYNARIYWHLLRLERAFVTYCENGELLIDGRKVKTVAFLNDYYWLSTNATTYGMVPMRSMLGAPICVSYGTKDGTLRLDRLFLTIE
jgi:signal peptidase I